MHSALSWFLNENVDILHEKHKNVPSVFLKLHQVFNQQRENLLNDHLISCYQRCNFHLPPCLQERPIYRGSQSTLGGKWGHAEEVELDELGRPVIWHDGEVSLRGGEMDGEKEERRRRVELYLKTSNMSLVLVSI